jgi:hypothetical protein
MEEISEWDSELITALVRLLARDALQSLALGKLTEIGDAAIPLLARMLKDESTDFVIRRRIPRVLARIGDEEAADALLEALSGGRFEVRYRAAIALVQRRRRGQKEAIQRWQSRVWDAVRAEVGRGRPVWELQKLLDDAEPDEDDLVVHRVGVRGELSLEHTFRLLSLVLDPDPVRAAFHGITLDNQNLKNYALEYLEQALPSDIRRRLWVFIGDVSEYQKAKAERPLGDVVNDLMTTRATLFAGEKEREALRRMLEETDE